MTKSFLTKLASFSLLSKRSNSRRRKGQNTTVRTFAMESLEQRKLLTATTFEAGFEGATLADNGSEAIVGSSVKLTESVGSISSPNGGQFLVLDTDSANVSTNKYGGTDGSVVDIGPMEIPQDGGQLKFSYNFLTRESKNSSYNDFAKINLVAPGGELLQEIVSVDTFSGLQSAAGSGYNYQTGWVEFELNVDQFSGQTIQLELVVSDDVDTIYDSALLFDAVSIEDTTAVVDDAEPREEPPIEDNDTDATDAFFGSDFSVGTMLDNGLNPLTGSNAQLVDSVGGMTSPKGGKFLSLTTNDAAISTNKYGGTDGSVVDVNAIKVPDSGGKVNFTFNFLTNEGGNSYYNDFAQINLVTPSGEILQELTTIDTYSGLKQGGKSGYVSQSGWIDFEANLDNYAGQMVKLEFVVSDKIDTLFDSALLIDDVWFS